MNRSKAIDIEQLMQKCYFVMGMAIKCSFTIPLLTVSESLLGNPAHEVWIWCYVAMLAAAVALGTLWTRIISNRAAKTDKRPIPSGFLRVFGYIVCALGLACAACIPHGPTISALIAFVVMLIDFICCMACARLNYNALLTFSQLFGLGVLYAVTVAAEALLHKFFDIQFLHSPMIISLIFVCACAAVLLNQSNLEALASRQRRISLPMRVRTSNLKLVLVTLAILLVGYIFRAQIIWAAEKVLYALWRCIFHLIRGIFAVIAWLGSLGASDNQTLPNSPGSSGEMTLPEVEESGNDGTWIAILLFAAIVIFIIIKFGPRFMRFISAKLKRFFAYLSALFGRSEDHNKSSDGLFQDSEEDLDIREDDKNRKITSRAARRQFRSALRRYDSLSGIDRIREGYRLMLESLSLRGTPANNTDTANEIPSNIDNSELAEKFALAAKPYDAARYGNCISDETNTVFDSAVKQTCSTASKRR